MAAMADFNTLRATSRTSWASAGRLPTVCRALFAVLCSFCLFLWWNQWESGDEVERKKWVHTAVSYLLLFQPQALMNIDYLALFRCSPRLRKLFRYWKAENIFHYMVYQISHFPNYPYFWKRRLLTTNHDPVGPLQDHAHCSHGSTSISHKSDPISFSRPTKIHIQFAGRAWGAGAIIVNINFASRMQTSACTSGAAASPHQPGMLWAHTDR